MAEISDADLSNLGILALETAWDAILASVPRLPSVPTRTSTEIPSSILDSIAGRYAFAPGAVAELRRKGNALEIELTGRTNDCFTSGQPVMLNPVAADEFELAGPRGDRLRIDRDARGAIMGITLNPGLWPLHAVRK